ncbi:MAG: hypothetical protein KGY76_05355 [Candidatus Thermoplasmatota archaeon]|nr:hypothetical protein [Candidatus Thermoplasmatota archaeon]
MVSASFSAAANSNRAISPEERDDSNDELTANGEEVKNKTLYMYRVKDAVSVGGRTTKEMYNTTYPEGQGNSTDQSYFKVVVDWYLFPALAGDLQLNGTSYLNIWGNSSGGDVEMTYNLTEVDEGGNSNMIAGNSVSYTMGNEWTPYEVPLNIDNYTVSEGSTLKVTYQIWGDSSTWYSIAYGGMVDGAMRDTNVTLPCMDYAEVSDVYTADSEGNVTNLFNPDAANKNITMYANVTDPFGGYDLEWTNLTLEGPNGVIMENVSMNKTYGFYNSFKTIYEVPWNYDGEPEGTYAVSVRAVDKNGMRAWERTGNFTPHDEYGYHSFVIGGLDNYVNLQLEDNQGYPLANTTVNLKPGPDTIFNSKETDDQGIVNFTVANATYLVSVNWQDIEVETNRTLDVGEVGNRTRSDPYNLTAAIFYPEFTVLDKEGSPVDEAKVYLTHPNGTTIIPPFSTDQAGTFSLAQTAEGTYHMEVRWKGRAVGTFEKNITWSSIDHTLNVEVYHLTVQVQDNASQPVPNALFAAAYNDTLQTAESLMTDSQGEVNTRLPGAEYLLEVTWNDARVYEDTYLLDSTDTIVITADIYEVTVSVYDTLGDPLQGAEVTATYTRTVREIGTNTTDNNGEVTFQLARGEHRFDVSWLGVDVAEETREVNSMNTSFEITASVYQLEFLTYDNTTEHSPLSQARISVRIGGDLVDTGSTDASGSYITKLPSTHIDAGVEWKGIEVYSLQNYQVVDNTNKTLYCDVYHLNVTIQDSQENPVEGADVSVQYQNNVIERGTSDENGSLMMRLPVEGYTIETTWNGIEVNETDYTMTAAQGQNELIIDADVYYVTLTVVDSEGDPLPDTQTELFVEGSLLFSETTDSDGVVETRLPAESYDIYFTWRGFEVNETTIEVDRDIDETINASVYHVSMLPRDSDQEAINGARIEVIHGDSTFESGRITGGEPLAMRLPEAEFLTVVRWQGVEVYSEVHPISQSEDIDLSCEVYYLTISGEDSRGEDVEGLIVSIYHTSLPEGQQLLTTISIDETPTERVPAGDIGLQAEWRGFIVAEAEVPVEEDRGYTLDCDIYYLNVTVVDSDGERLDGANLVIKDEGGTTFVTETAEGGTAIPILPSGTWTLEAYWMDEKVGTNTTEIEDEGFEMQIETDVHDLRVIVVDSSQKSLIGAGVDLLDSDGNLVYSRRTDQDGEVSFDQLFGGNWTLEVQWKDEMVHSSTFELTESVERTLETDVHDLQVTVNDSEGDPLVGAEVSLLDMQEELVQSKETDENGLVGYDQLPGGNWNIEVRWKDEMVASTTFELTESEESQERTLETDVHDLQVTVNDSEGEPLYGAKVFLLDTEEELVQSKETDENGVVGYDQLPGGNWNIEIRWKGEMVHSTTFELSESEESQERTLTTNVHNIQVTVNDSEGTPLDGAEVRLIDMEQELMNSDETSEDGTVAFDQIPGRNYTLEAHWKNAKVGSTTFKLNESVDRTLVTRVHDLQIMVKDGEGESLKGAEVTLLDSEGDKVLSKETDKDGVVRFEQLVEGDYTVRTRYRTTYLLTNVDLETSPEVSLNSTQERQIEFNDYPPAIYTTNLFFAILALVVIALIGLVPLAREKEVI